MSGGDAADEQVDLASQAEGEDGVEQGGHERGTDGQRRDPGADPQRGDAFATLGDGRREPAGGGVAAELAATGDVKADRAREVLARLSNSLGTLPGGEPR